MLISKIYLVYLSLNHMPCFFIAWEFVGCCIATAVQSCVGKSVECLLLLWWFPQNIMWWYLLLWNLLQHTWIFRGICGMWIRTCYATTLWWFKLENGCSCMCVWMYVLCEHVCVHTQLYRNELVHSASFTVLYTTRLSIQSILLGP